MKNCYLHLASIEFMSIKLVDGSLHVSPGGKLHASLVPPVCVSISVAHITSLAHQILQILEKMKCFVTRKYFGQSIFTTSDTGVTMTRISANILLKMVKYDRRRKEMRTYGGRKTDST